MNGARFGDLFGWEWRRVGRTPLLWIVLAILAASFIWGALNTAGLHRDQTAAQQRTVAAEAAHERSMAQRVEAYRAPPTPDRPEAPYWQDPTNMSGFSQYFVFKNALKPHLPLSPLAAGVSDLAPSRLTIKLNTLFGFDDTYDFENPRGLALGRFDLGFALAYLLPIGLILLFGLLVTFERDRGMMRLIAAQSTSPRRWLLARVSAIMVWTAPTVLASIIIALVIAGADLATAAAEVIAALGLVLAYLLLWSGVAVLVLSSLPGAAGAIGAMTAIWALLTIGVPLAVAAITAQLDPPPSPVAYIDRQRQVADEVQESRDRILAQAFAARADLRGAIDQIPKLDHATRLTFLTGETESRLRAWRDEAAAHAERAAQIATIAGYAAPSVGLQSALATLAGADAARHRRFEAQARAYQLRLRGDLYPRVQAQIVRPTPRPSPPTRGRYNFEGQADLPRFQMVEQPASRRIAAVVPLTLWMTIAGAGLGLVGLQRARKWPPV